LRKAAEAGDEIGMRALGNRLLDGRGLAANPTEGEQWLRKAVEAGDGPSARILGTHFYSSKDLAAAANLFLKGHHLGDLYAGNNLAYMVRRSELPRGLQAPSIVDLLALGITKKSSFALVNYALCLAGGVQCAINWDAADHTVGALTKTEELKEVAAWWHKLACSNDREGHLVLGLLARHKLVTDPDGWTMAQRFQAARAGGWDMPDWMLDPVA
jgi:TPR repeat protein